MAVFELIAAHLPSSCVTRSGAGRHYDEMSSRLQTRLLDAPCHTSTLTITVAMPC
jgi:hypothetical protein